MKLTFRSEELDSNERTQIAGCVNVRIEVRWESTRRIVFDVADDFFVSSILADARDPNLVAMAFRKLRYVVFQVLRHVGGQIFGIVVEFGMPIVDSVEFQEEARRRVVEAIGVLVLALIEFAEVQFADLAVVAESVEVTGLLVARADSVV